MLSKNIEIHFLTLIPKKIFDNNKIELVCDLTHLILYWVTLNYCIYVSTYKKMIQELSMFVLEILVKTVIT